MLDWKFQKNEDGTSVGWNDPGLQHFRVDRIKNLAKETIQNSTDNPVLDGNSPVRVVFSLEERERDEIPGIQSLEEAIIQCESDMSRETESSRKEIKKAVQVIKRDKIKVLSIADYGTTGMGESFYTFLKTMGTSADDVNRTGSHGMGKNAPVVTSALRTIIVSSVWRDKTNSSLCDAVQGRTILKGRKVSDGSTYKNEGFWGKGFHHIRANEHDYPWINRQGSEIGTSIHVLGFETGSQTKNPHGWVFQIVAAAITTYFASFAKGKLELEINYAEDKNLIVDQKSIESWFKRGFPELEDSDQIALQNAYLYYQLLTSKNTEIEEHTFNVDYLGECNLMLRVSDIDELPKKVCILRDGINITDELSTFYKQPPNSLMDFVGIFECKSNEGKRFIRRMEPPQHNNIDYEQLSKDEHEIGKTVLRQLGKKLREIVKNNAQYPENDETRIDALSEFLEDVDEDGKAGVEVDPNGNWGLPSPKPLPKPKKIPKLEPESETTNSEIRQTGPKREGNPKPEPVTPPESHPGSEDGAILSPYKTNQPVELSQPRVIKIANNKLKLFLNVQSTTKNCSIQLLEMGSETSEKIAISFSDVGVCSDGEIVLDLEKNIRHILTVELERPLLGAAEIVATRKIKEQEG